MSFWTKYRLAGLALYIGLMIGLMVFTLTDMGKWVFRSNVTGDSGRT